MKNNKNDNKRRGERRVSVEHRGRAVFNLKGGGWHAGRQRAFYSDNKEEQCWVAKFTGSIR
jgi:hypothetical protein